VHFAMHIMHTGLLRASSQYANMPLQPLHAITAVRKHAITANMPLQPLHAITCHYSSTPTCHYSQAGLKCETGLYGRSPDRSARVCNLC